MPKNNLKGRHARERIAHFAAKIMAEDGVTDFASAKRKAARMAGAEDTRNLPDNIEIEEALRQHQRLFQDSEHDDLIHQLRTQALNLMRVLKEFHPHLTGSVLAGYAEAQSTIHIQLFPESEKDVEIFLLNKNANYEARETRMFIGGEIRAAPTFILEVEGFSFTLSVFSYNDLRQKIRQTPTGKPLEKANISQIESLLLRHEDSD